MSEPENFIARWARRKREALDEAERPEAVAGAEEEASGSEASPDVIPRTEHKGLSPLDASQGKPEPAFDLTQLPSIESITAETDIRAFLAPGVPADLARAALRRVWATDPTIRDFKGLADYDWDFTTPGAIPGFGPLEMTDELRQMVTDLVGRSLTPPPEPPTTGLAAEPVLPTAESSAELTRPEAGQSQQSRPAAQVTQEVPVNTSDESRRIDQATPPTIEYIALQHSPENSQPSQSIVRRPHGRALPR